MTIKTKPGQEKNPAKGHEPTPADGNQVRYETYLQLDKLLAKLRMLCA